MSNTPLMYSDLLAVVRAELEYSGIPEGVDDIAKRVAAEFCRKHGGKTYRVPTLKGMIKARRDETIRAEAGTKTIEQLARLHSLTAKHIREIISNV